MNKIEHVFKNGPTFVGYMTGGDGGADYGIECGLQLIEGGVDILEIGLPFSDPVADGPVIQRASNRALEQGACSEAILKIAKGIRKRSDVPLILFSYFNPLLKKGMPFLKNVYDAGFNAVLVVDLPAPTEEKYSHFYYQALKESGLHPIFLVAPSTDEYRLEQIKKISQGFIYYACQKGTTGAKDKLPEDFSFHISRLRRNSCMPIAAGFGIAKRETARAALQYADGFVVGSAFVQKMEERVHPQELKKLAQAIDPRKERL